MTAETPLSKNEPSIRVRADIFERVRFMFIIAASGVVLLLGGLAVFGVSRRHRLPLREHLLPTMDPPLTPCSVGITQINARSEVMSATPVIVNTSHKVQT